MHIRFETVEKIGLPGLLANATIIFDKDGPLGGLCLKGFAVWKSKKHHDQLTVTFPSRPYHNKQYWLLRSADDEDTSPVWRLREMILKEFEVWRDKKL